jgi:hypothetical protein
LFTKNSAMTSRWQSATRFSAHMRQNGSGIEAMAIAPTPVSPYRSVDINGRALPMTEEEILQRNADAIRALDEVAEMGDQDEQRATLQVLMTAIDDELGLS